MTLDLTPLQDALKTLEKILTLLKDDPRNDVIRDATIQRFEYCYELSHKMLRRYLRETEASELQVDELSFADLIRLGSSRNLLLSDWSQWKQYRTARNATSHTYDEDQAIKVIAVIPNFYLDAKHLLNKLQQAK